MGCLALNWNYFTPSRHWYEPNFKSDHVGVWSWFWSGSQAYRFLEFFSGQGNLTWCLKQEGFRGLQLDRDFGGRFNNIFEPSGFAQLASLVMVCMSLCANFWGAFPCMRNSVCITYTYLYKIYLYSQYPFFSVIVYAFGWQLRLALLSVLQLFPGSLVVLAPVCSSFSFMSSSQSSRYIWMPEGDERYSWVKSGNVMSVRVVLLCYLCAALGLVFLVEQPASGKFAEMPRWQRFCTEICYDSLLVNT